MLSRIAFVLTALGVLGLAACNGGGTTVVTPTPGPTCGPIVSSQLLYPVPGSTSVPDSTSMIAIAVSPALASNVYNLFLYQSPTNYAVTGNNLVTISQSQLPPGSATATISNPTYMEVQLINPLPAATQITSLAINNGTTDTTNCTPQTIPNSSFTTQ